MTLRKHRWHLCLRCAELTLLLSPFFTDTYGYAYVCLRCAERSRKKNWTV